MHNILFFWLNLKKLNLALLFDKSKVRNLPSLLSLLSSSSEWCTHFYVCFLLKEFARLQAEDQQGPAGSLALVVFLTVTDCLHPTPPFSIQHTKLQFKLKMNHLPFLVLTPMNSMGMRTNRLNCIAGVYHRSPRTSSSRCGHNQAFKHQELVSRGLLTKRLVRWGQRRLWSWYTY